MRPGGWTACQGREGKRGGTAHPDDALNTLCGSSVIHPHITDITYERNENYGQACRARKAPDAVSMVGSRIGDGGKRHRCK